MRSARRFPELKAHGRKASLNESQFRKAKANAGKKAELDATVRSQTPCHKNSYCCSIWAAGGCAIVGAV